MASGTGAAWGLMAAAQVCEGLGDCAEAEKCVRDTAEHYPTSRDTWFLWCVRTGRGDLAAARKPVEDRIARLQGADEGGLLFTEVALHVTAGKPDQALAALREFMATRSPSRLTLLYAALLADELGRAKERDELLDRVVNPPPRDPAAPPRPPAARRPP